LLEIPEMEIDGCVFGCEVVEFLFILFGEGRLVVLRMKGERDEG
jgi:hypothetical protein